MALVCASELDLAPDQIAVALTHGAFGGHLGIAFRPLNETPRILHLRWHEKLAVDRFPPPMALEFPFPRGLECWVSCVVAVPTLAAKQVVGMVRTVATKMPRIAFGLNVIAFSGSFTPKGEYVPPPGSDGLTCATFVLAVLRAAAVRLVDEGTWLPQPENVQWGLEVIKSLKQTGASQAHINAVSSNNVGLRIRPEEVTFAASSAIGARPLNYGDCIAGVPAMISTLHSCCPLERLLPSLIRGVFPLMRRYRIPSFFS